jgi:hypothetical protein
LFDEPSEVLEGDSIPESYYSMLPEDRACDSFCHCLSCHNHTGNCYFTSRKDGCSMTTAQNIVSILTGGKLKSLSGLDDIKVIQEKKKTEYLVFKVQSNSKKEYPKTMVHNVYLVTIPHWHYLSK